MGVRLMAEKIRYWWSEDRKWFCILIDDGVHQATVSLTPDEADALADEADAHDHAQSA